MIEDFTRPPAPEAGYEDVGTRLLTVVTVHESANVSVRISVGASEMNRVSVFAGLVTEKRRAEVHQAVSDVARLVHAAKPGHQLAGFLEALIKAKGWLHRPDGLFSLTFTPGGRERLEQLVDDVRDRVDGR